LEKSNKAKSIIAQTIKELEMLKESTQSKFDDIQEKRVLLIERA
jgi:hypothetical protein